VKWKTTALFRDVTQRVVVIPYQNFGTTYRSDLEGSRNQEEEKEKIEKGKGWGWWLGKHFLFLGSKP
jgi:hypothetical protein